MNAPSDTVRIEEIEIEKPGNPAWFALGAIAIVIAIVFGVRAAQKKRREKLPATPTAELPT